MSAPATPVFIPVLIAELRAETPELFHLRLKAPQEFLSAYSAPGQYVQIQIEGMKPGFFAIACGPAKEQLEFLIKRGAPVADAIGMKKAGDTLSVTAPGGKGYPLAQAHGRDVYVVGVGSGMAPLRSLMHTLMAKRAEFADIHFLYGARKAAMFPYAAEVEDWKRAGIRVTLACSQPDAGSWSGAVGHIQDVFKAAQPKAAANSAVFVCGMKPMVEGVKAVFAELGVASDRVFQNF